MVDQSSPDSAELNQIVEQAEWYAGVDAHAGLAFHLAKHWPQLRAAIYSHGAAQPPSNLPKPETMLTYASILEKPQYWVDPRGQKWLLATGEIIEAACAALRHCAETYSVPSTDQEGGK